MCNISQSNQRKLLEGIAAPGVTVTVRSLAKYMACAGVLVTPHIGRMRGYISLTGAMYGVKPEAMTESGSAFYNERVSQGHLNFIPRDDEATLATLEKRLRRAVETYSLTDGFMPMKAYESLKEDFTAIRTAYFEKRDEIVAKWDSLMADFKLGAKEMLAGLQLQQNVQDQILGEFLSSAPSRDKYAQSFSMGLKVHAFPSEVGEMQGLAGSVAGDVLDTWKEEVVSTAILSIEKQVGIGWDKMLSAMRQYLKDETIATTTINSLIKFADELSWKNVFANSLLTDLAQSLSTLKKADKVMAKAEIIEDALTSLYGYAKETRIELDLKKAPYSETTLDDMLKLKKQLAATA